VDRLFLIGSSGTRRRPVSHQICTPNNRHRARRPAEGFRVVAKGREKRNKRQPPGEHDRIADLISTNVQPMLFLASFARCIVTF
jgi:hypothetical protein